MKRLSDCGELLKTMVRVVDFGVFRSVLEKALAYGDGAKGGRPPYDPVAMFKILTLTTQNTVSDARMEFLIRDRLNWPRFLGFDLGAATPDEKIIRLFREKLTRVQAKVAQKDTDARWTLKFAKARALPDGRPVIGIAIPSFGYKSSIATVKRYHHETHDQLRQHLTDFVAAYNFARRLKTLRRLTPYEAICKIWTEESERFISNLHHQSLGPNN